MWNRTTRQIFFIQGVPRPAEERADEINLRRLRHNRGDAATISYQSTRIGRRRRLVFQIPIKVTVPRIKPQWILARPSPNRRIVIPRPVVLEAGHPVELASGPQVAVAGRGVGLADD